MRSLFKWGVALASAPLVYYTLNQQQQQDIFGGYRSIVNSSRAALILYSAVKDYQISLLGIPYNSEDYHRIRHEVHLRVANRILELSKANRGIYLKLGQYLGNLQKVVPWQFTHVLKVLQDSAPPIDYKQMKIVIESDLHKKYSDIFSIIQEKAIASASLAQVHRAVLASNGKQVALKVQYPFLQVQSKWDLRVLRYITKFCNQLIKRNKSSQIDLLKLFETWTSTLVEELDFRIELQNALKTKQSFKDNPHVYIPQYYTDLCSQRLLVMEFVNGVKINQKADIQALGIAPQKVATNLLDIFTTMIYKHGFVHCDAHPGNILVRKRNNDLGHDIVLLDHGLYRTISPTTIHNFSGLWVSLMLQDRRAVYDYAHKLNIQNHMEYLPLIFLQRTANSHKKIGATMTPEERKYFRQKDLANFDSINDILQDLPPQLMFIIRASNLVSSHNLALGSNNRQRFFYYGSRSIRALYPSVISYVYRYCIFIMRLWLFQNFPRIYISLFGSLEG